MAGGTQRRGADGLVSGTLGISSAAFGLLRDLIAQHTGVFYGDSKRDLLADRLAEVMVARGLPSFLDYYYLLKYDDAAGAAWSELHDRLAVPETYFWRQPDQFRALLEGVLPRRATREPLRIWSAACCSGEEPLSVAMALDSAGWLDRLDIQIVGSDASPAQVARARAGVYGERSLRNLPAEWRERYFTPEGNRWRIDAALHARVRWATANLVDEAQAGPLASAEVIYLRNVLIYFSDEAVRRVANLLYQRMPSDGYLFLGASESFARLGVGFVMDEIADAFVYRKAP